MKLTKRGDTFHLRRRVPRRYQRVEDRPFVWLSMHTDSEHIAEKKAKLIWDEMIEAWESKLIGMDEDAIGRMEAARNLAAKKGFRWMDAKHVASLPLADILERVEAVGRKRGGRPDKVDADAVLGGAKPAKIGVRQALSLYWKIAKADTMGKTKDQIRRWENPRKKAVANFIDAMGWDIPLDELSTRDLFKFREWWVEKIEAEGLSANSANKDFTHLVSMLRKVARAEEITLSIDTKGLAVPMRAVGVRPPFSDRWIRDKLLAGGALDALNAQARDILLIMVNTGARPSEIAGLAASEIVLGDKVPHLNISGAGRSLKTRSSKRRIPLIGVSLEAARRNPQGFPRYFDNPGLTDTINKFLRENDLLETDRHTLYCLRHSFEDRMLRAGVDERIRRDMMGHALQRERYGAGGGLDHVHGLLLPISF